jgi:hypothetical protein
LRQAQSHPRTARKRVRAGEKRSLFEARIHFLQGSKLDNGPVNTV